MNNTKRLEQSMVHLFVKFSEKKRRASYKMASLLVGVLFFLLILPAGFIAIGEEMGKTIPVNLHRSIELIIASIGISVGLFFLFWATYSLHKTGRGTPAPNAPTQKLVIIGPYKYCRNPIEFGAILYYLGVGTAIGGMVVGVVCCVLGFAIGSAYHKGIEEKELEERFGEEYRRYKAQTPFIFPKIKRRRKADKRFFNGSNR